MPNSSPGLIYTCLLVGGFLFALGFIAREIAGKWSFLPLAAYGITLLAGPFWGFWEHFKSRPEVQARPSEEPREDLQGDSRVLVQTDEENTYALEETGSDEPVFLDECDTLLRDVKVGASVRLKVKAVTVVAFVKAGWLLNFNSADMINKIVLDDGRHTEVTRTLWDRVTDGLARAHLIVKEPRHAIRPLHSMRGMLTYIVPDPTPANWRSFNR